MSTSVLITSGKLVLYVNGNLFARVAGFRFGVDSSRRKIHAVDSIVPFELGIGAAQVSGQMTLFRTSMDGAAEGPGMVAPMDQMSNEKYFSMVLVDLTTQTAIFQADSCSVDSQSWSVEARGLMMGNVNWSALSYRNEVRPLG